MRWYLDLPWSILHSLGFRQPKLAQMNGSDGVTEKWSYMELKNIIQISRIVYQTLCVCACVKYNKHGG